VSWLGEVVDLPEDVSLEHLHEALVKVGFEEEDVHGYTVTGPIVVGRVLSREPEPQSNGKTINWCQVDVGESEPRGIVCGAPNFEAGDLVVVTLPGASLPGPTPDEPFVIAARKTYGHVSDGMIASERELGLGDDHAGIIVLGRRGITAEPGDDAIALLGLDDAAVEINVTPDRGYALSMRGVGREYSHSTGATYRDPAAEPGLVSRANAAKPIGFSVTIQDDSPVRGRVGCDAFAARVVRGIDPNAPTPPWMAARLRLAGVRSISLAVDITNYVMLEFGQPTHAYDLDKLQGGITVRRAQPGERITTLDGQDRELDVEDLLITDGSGAIGIAGVMGGESTEVSAATTDVLIEAAHFDPVTIARSARRHRLWSEASKRFERGVDPAIGRLAAQRVVDLLVELGGGTADDEFGAIIDETSAPAAIPLPRGFVDSMVGAAYTDDEVVGTLSAIGCAVTSVEEGWSVVPPTWRGDLRTKADLTEEVARVVGYDRIPSALPIAPPGRGLTAEQRLRRVAAQALAGFGLVEVLAYPFVSEADNDRFGRAEGGAGHVPAMRLANAIDPAASFMRTSLIPGLIQIARRNLSRGLTDLAISEIGRVFLPDDGVAYGSESLPIGHARPSDEVLAALYASVPAQPWRVAALFTGDAVAKQPGVAAVPSGIADAVSTARHLARALGVDLAVRQGAHQALHPGRTAELLLEGRVVGYAGELLPALAADLDLPRVVAVFELDLDAIVAAVSGASIAPISGYPAATQDVSLLVGADVPAGTVLEALVQGAGPLLEDARLVDDYRGQGIPEGSKSLTFALRFRAADRTLTQAEATEAKLAGVARAGELTGATIRD